MNTASLRIQGAVSITLPAPLVNLGADISTDSGNLHGVFYMLMSHIVSDIKYVEDQHD